MSKLKFIHMELFSQIMKLLDNYEVTVCEVGLEELTIAIHDTFNTHQKKLNA
jgi:hypothetical protein